VLTLAISPWRSPPVVIDLMRATPVVSDLKMFTQPEPYVENERGKIHGLAPANANVRSVTGQPLKDNLTLLSALWPAPSVRVAIRAARTPAALMGVYGSTRSCCRCFRWAAWRPTPPVPVVKKSKDFYLPDVPECLLSRLHARSGTRRQHPTRRESKKPSARRNPTIATGELNLPPAPRMNESFTSKGAKLPDALPAAAR
jgi:hypothetical protein